MDNQHRCQEPESERVEKKYHANRKKKKVGLAVKFQMIVNPSGPGLFFVGRSLMTVSISASVMGLFNSAVASGLSFGKWWESKNFSISWWSSNLWEYSSL